MQRPVQTQFGSAIDRFRKDNGNDNAGNAVCRCYCPTSKRVKPLLTSAGKGRRDTCLFEWARAFVFAGSAACVLLIVRFFPDYWFVSLFALTPFLIRASKATVREGARLAFIFGSVFLLISGLDRLLADPWPTAAKSVAGVAAFTLFGAALGWTRKRFGFNPVIVGLLWVGIEFGLIKLDLVASTFGEAEFSSRNFFSLTALFGFLMVSFLIVFINSLLIVAVDRVISLIKSGEIAVPTSLDNKIFLPIVRPLSQRVNRIPNSRAPPLRSPLVT